MTNPLVTIIINNYNYGRYLGEAIESALTQTYQAVEVIVVDDGSTDESAEVIAHYGDSICPILQKNGGQAAAFNAGFAESHGAIIIFLDADDQLAPDVVARVIDCFAADPTLAKVQYRLRTMDELSRPGEATVPAAGQAMPNGDVRRFLLQFPDDLRWQPTSGNAFPRAVLTQIFPMPTAAYRICADYFLSNITPLFGPVRSIDVVGGYYRIHGANQHNRTGIELAQTRAIITRTIETHRDLKRFADLLGLPFAADPTAVLSVTFLAHRLISRKLAPQEHPLQRDTIGGLVARGIWAAAHRLDTTIRGRVLYGGWFLLMGLAPPALGWAVADQFLGSGRYATPVAWLHKGRQRFMSLHRHKKVL